MELFRLLGTIAINNKEANKAIEETTTKASQSESKMSNAFGKIGNSAQNLASKAKTAFGKIGTAAKAAASAIGTAAKAAGAVAAAGLAVATTAIGALTKSAISAYADFEQLVGGVETLFGAGGKSLTEYAKSVGKTVEEVEAEYNNLMTAQDMVLASANKAYKTAGMSANEYMETVTSFSASLIASLDGDTVAAAKKADQAIIDMADNANKMGSSMESIQNAYQGFAKQNYTINNLMSAA